MNDETPNSPGGENNNWEPLPDGSSPSNPPPSEPPRSEPEWVTPEVQGAPGAPVGGGSAQTGLVTCLVLGGLETICCCPSGSPFGIAAIVLAAIGLSKNSNQNYVEARKMQKFAIWLLVIGFVIALALLLFSLVSGSGSFFNEYQKILDDIESSTSTTLIDGYPAG